MTCCSAALLVVLSLQLLSIYGQSEGEGDQIEGSENIRRSVQLAEVLRAKLSDSEAKDINNFTSFIQRYNKQYKDEKEVAYRYGVFKESLKQIEILRKESPLAVFDVNRFSDLTPDEFTSRKACGTNPGNDTPKSNSYIHHDPYSYEEDQGEGLNADEDSEEIPIDWDWRYYDAVSPVKDQENCGCCYAFAAIAAVESQHLINTNESVDLSEQEIVSCTFGGEYNNSGCYSGRIDNALHSILDHGVTSEEEFPYKSGKSGVHGLCMGPTPRIGKISNYKMILTWQEEGIVEEVYKYGPVITTLDARPLQHYKSGILNATRPVDGWTINHAVLLVGYDEEDGVPYWIVKNSWGPEFGEEGFFRIVRGGNRLGICNYNLGVYY